jgi:glutaredoxin
MGLRTMGAVLGTIGVVLALQAVAQGNVYRWTDKEGKVHFSDTPPVEEAKDLTQRRMGSSSSLDSAALPYETQVAMKRNPVSLYVADKCAPCDSGRALLSSRGIPYTEHNAQGNAGEIDTVKKLTGSSEVPLLLVGDRTVKGYDAGAWTAALDAAGYPRSLLPGRRAPEPARVGGPPAPEPPAGGTPPADTPAR